MSSSRSARRQQNPEETRSRGSAGGSDKLDLLQDAGALAAVFGASRVISRIAGALVAKRSSLIRSAAPIGVAGLLFGAGYLAGRFKILAEYRAALVAGTAANVLLVLAAEAFPPVKQLMALSGLGGMPSPLQLSSMPPVQPQPARLQPQPQAARVQPTAEEADPLDDIPKNWRF